MKLLKQLYKINSPSYNEFEMKDFLRRYLQKLNLEFVEDNTGNIYVTKGQSDLYPCVVAHIDEVHSRNTNNFVLVQTNTDIFGYDAENHKQIGIGADDKNGIWVALKCLKKYKVIKCVFFVGEEVGCQGSGNCDLNFFNDCKFVLQCDRKGNSDFIIEAGFTQLCSQEFVDKCNLEQFGYRTATGLMTDVMSLREQGCNLCMCNISCGYYNPHSQTEYTVISELYKCYDFVCNIIETVTDKYTCELDNYCYYNQVVMYNDICDEEFDKLTIDLVDLIDSRPNVSESYICGEWWKRNKWKYPYLDDYDIHKSYEIALTYVDEETTTNFVTT